MDKSATDSQPPTSSAPLTALGELEPKRNQRNKKPVVSRSTKPFSAFHGTDLNGAFPKGFLEWLREMGWIGNDDRFVETCHLCSGRIKDPSAFTIDIRPEMEPDLVADATATGLPDNSYKYTVVDPPYSEELAAKLYGTREHFASIDVFVREAVRLTKPGGFATSLSYEVPKIPKGTDLVACWGIYTIPHKSFMRCLAVFKKREPTPESARSTKQAA